MKKQILWIAIVLAVVAVSSSAYAGDHEYVGAAKCKMCHKVQYASWEGTKHAKATDTAKAGTDQHLGQISGNLGQGQEGIEDVRADQDEEGERRCPHGLQQRPRH